MFGDKIDKDLADECRFTRAGYSGYGGQDAEWKISVEVAEIVAGNIAEL
jgi:hypothetical protein